MTNTNQQYNFIAHLNSNPKPDHIKQNDDGSFYIPISIVQTLLDDIFIGNWSFEVTTVEYGTKWARGSGRMEVINPITGQKIVRSGDAGILLVGNLRIDSPRLEAMILLSCAKKFGKIFGRDLNRAKDDAPLPTVAIEKSELGTTEKRISALIDDSENYEELSTYKHLVPASLKSKYEQKLKTLSL